MQGGNFPLFFPEKKNPVLAGEEDRRMKPAANDSSMYLFMASVSGMDREYRWPLGGNVPGRSSIPMSYGLCGCKEVALALLNTAPRSRYTEGPPISPIDVRVMLH